MIRLIPIGTSDFRDLREQDFEYVDKTNLITEIIDRRNIKVVLLPRPRRFGKSVNLSMLKWFFEKRDENLWHLFEDLHVARAGDQYRAHFQKYPVIHISLKETKAKDFAKSQEKARQAIRNMYEVHRSDLEGHLQGANQADFQAILNETASDAVYELSLKNLTRYLHQVHGVRPIVLIDEYDAGIHASHLNGFYDDAIDFFGSFYLAGLKDNEHLERAVMTGILRVSKESIFSDLNNLGVYTLLVSEYNTCFGFTEDEVAGLMRKAGMPESMESLRDYYNGYEFGGQAIYNPWSILSFLASDSKQLMPYWIMTSSNALAKQLLQHHAFAVEEDIRTLLEGGSIEKELDENTVFPDLRKYPRELWNILVFAGYLKACRPGPVIINQPPPPFRLSIPNREVERFYRTTFQTWMDEALGANAGALDALLEALLTNKAQTFEKLLQKFAECLPSYHDVEGTEPEKFYHGMMIGLLAGLEPHYEVRSNRESGTGRPDVLIKPRKPGKPGVVLELKAAERGEKSIEKAMEEGLLQLETHDYAAELRAAGVEKIHQMAIAFDGKRVMVLPKGSPPPEKPEGTSRKKATKTTTKTAKKTTKKTRKK
jgi:hypothetical protein